MEQKNSKQEVVVKAPTKINIVLKITGRRPNGYHDLLMLNEKLELADTVRIRRWQKAEEVGSRKSEVGSQISDLRGPKITITCDDESVPCDERNLCHKAAKALVNYCICHPESTNGGRRISRTQLNSGDSSLISLAQNDIIIHIEKRIPVAGGLGGGSSDAAAVLKGLNELLDLNISTEVLADIGVKLGADVPFFLYDGPAICEGIGDKITLLDKLPNMWILLVNPNIPVSTKYVYETFDEKYALQLTGDNRHVSLPRYFKGLADVAAVVQNDLELVTANEHPEIKEIEKTIEASGAVKSWMSGSGATVIGMFDAQEKRDRAFENLIGRGWRVIKTSNLVR